jgi:plasmid stabilization system protein ParE
MNVIYLNRAVKDVNQHYAYLQARNQKAALDFLTAILTIEKSLSHMPFTGQKSFNDKIRFKQIARFRIKIFYRVNKNHITILRLYHFASLNPYQS